MTEQGPRPRVAGVAVVLATTYVIGRGGELRLIAHIGQGAANTAEKVALLAAEVAADLGRYADQDDTWGCWPLP